MKGPFFEIEPVWSDRGLNGQKDVAEISIRLGHQVLTRLAEVERGTTRDFFRASATSLALWIADNWWRLRSEPIDDPRLPSADWRLRHELSAVSGGTLWPPLMIYSAGERIVISPSIGRRAAYGPVQYLDASVGMMSGNEFEVGIDRFLETVTSECTSAADSHVLRELVRQLGSERKDPELSAWRRLEACLGYDADQAPDAVIETLTGMEDTVGEAGVEEAAIAHKGSDAPIVLQKAIDASRTSTLVVNFDLSNKVLPNPDLRLHSTPWRLAEDAAAQVRSLIGLPRGPIRGRHFADMLSIRWETLKQATATARSLPYAARLKMDADREHVAVQTFRSRDRRFELSRMLGDAIWTQGSPFGVISRAKTDRQKYQRAFAQSLLCPISDLRNHVDFDEPRIEQIERAAQYFHVHNHVVRNLLVYKGVLPRETLDDQLEAA